MFLISSSPFISKFSIIKFHILFPITLFIMTTKKIEMKVDIDCEKCKHAILEAVTELEGVNQVSLDQEKSILTVVGTMDPVCIAKQLKKIKQTPVVISVGPPKKPEPKKPECKPCYGYYYPDYVSVNTYEGGSGCTIM